MKQQPPENKALDNRIKHNWEVQPALAANGRTQLISVRLGRDFEIFIHKGLATALSNALIDCVENDETTTVTKQKGTIL